MPQLKDAKIGDEVLIRAKVDRESTVKDFVVISLLDSIFIVSKEEKVEQIIPREIKVGDKVKSFSKIYSIISIDGRWAWCKADDGELSTRSIENLILVEGV